MTLHQLTKSRTRERTLRDLQEAWLNTQWINRPPQAAYTAYDEPDHINPVAVIRRTVFTRHGFSHFAALETDFIREWLTYQLATYVRTHGGYNMGIVRIQRTPINGDPLAEFDTYLAEVEADFPANGVPI